MRRLRGCDQDLDIPLTKMFPSRGVQAEGSVKEPYDAVHVNWFSDDSRVKISRDTSKDGALPVASLDLQLRPGGELKEFVDAKCVLSSQPLLLELFRCAIYPVPGDGPSSQKREDLHGDISSVLGVDDGYIDDDYGLGKLPPPPYPRSVDKTIVFPFSRKPNCLTMSARLVATVTFVLITGSAIVIIHDRTRHVTAGSSRLGDDDVFTEKTRERFGKSETEETNYLESFAGEDDFSLIMNNLNAVVEEKVGKREPVEKRSARRRRSADDADSPQLGHLTVALKKLESENNQLKATVKELQGASKKFTAKVQEIETKSNLAISQQMTQAAAAHQQQQLAIGQLQLQVSQLSTNTMKLQDENEALRTRLQTLTADVTAGESRQSALHEKVEMLQVQASVLVSNVSDIKSGSVRTAPRESEYSLAGRRVPQTK